MYDYLKDEKMMKEEQIKAPIRYVQCEVLKHDTPLQLCKLAAGEHQRIQQDTRECQTADIIEMLRHECTKKYVNTETQSAQLTDDELYVQLESLGLVKESSLGKLPKGTKKSTEEYLVCCNVLQALL